MIELTTRDDKKQLLYPLPRPLVAAQVHLHLIGTERIDALWQEHAEKYGSLIKLKTWKENVLALPSETKEIDFSNAQLQVTTSYHAQIVRDNRLRDIKPLTVQGVLRTSDERIVAGVRQGFVQNGKVSLIPLGYAAATSGETSGNPLFEQLYMEGEEELGVKPKELEEVKLIGYQTDPEFTQGVNLVFLAQSKLNASQIQEIYDASYVIYQKAHDQTLQETTDKSKARRAAKQAVKDAGYANINIGDHHPLRFLEDKPATLQEIIDQQHVNIDAERYPLMAICRGGLKLYLEQRVR